MIVVKLFVLAAVVDKLLYKFPWGKYLRHSSKHV